MSIKLSEVSDPRLRQRLQEALEGATPLDIPPKPTDATAPRQTPVRPITEAELHDQVEAYCRLRGWYFIHSRMDQRTTVAVGCPDFAIFTDYGRTLFLELKRPGGKATPKQLATIAHLRKLGHMAAIVDNWPDALLLLK